MSSSDKHLKWLSDIAREYQSWFPLGIASAGDAGMNAPHYIGMAVLAKVSALCAESGLIVDRPECSNLFIPDDGDPNGIDITWEIGDFEIVVDLSGPTVKVQCYERVEFGGMGKRV